jgi:segregation and condensation protein B
LTTEGEKQPDLPISAPPASAVESEGAPAMDEQEPQEAAQTELQQLKEAARFATPERVLQILEALFFAADKPLDLRALEETTQFSREVLQAALVELQAMYAPGTGGVALLDLGGRWQLRTEPQASAYVRRLLQVKPLRLTRAALETLSIIAYRQPITRPEMEDLRGVDCGAVTKALLERKLIRILGKKDEPGRPLLYGTTKEFLELFNLRDLTQLPTLREFQELSEESRRIVEEESKPPPPVAGLTELAPDPGIEERMMHASAESESALAQLESAMDRADESAKSTAAVLTPPAPPAPDDAPKGE